MTNIRKSFVDIVFNIIGEYFHIKNHLFSHNQWSDVQSAYYNNLSLQPLRVFVKFVKLRFQMLISVDCHYCHGVVFRPHCIAIATWLCLRATSMKRETNCAAYMVIILFESRNKKKASASKSTRKSVAHSINHLSYATKSL